MRLPTAEELSPGPEYLESATVLQNFLGKTLEEAEPLFAKWGSMEDLESMAPAGFRFYVQAAINYVKSQASTNDSTMVSCFADVLAWVLKREAAEELIPVSPQLASVCGYIVQHYDRFDISPEIYGDLRPRYLLLEQTFLQQAQIQS